MINTKIYGLLNEDREIVFISDCQPVDWNPDYWIDEDADWKMIKLNNEEMINEIGGIHWDNNVIILDTIEDKDEEKIKEILKRWISIIKPKYILDYISPEDLETFKIQKEKEWEEEGW